MPRKKSFEKYWPSDEEVITWIANGAVNYPSDWDFQAVQPILDALAAFARVKLKEMHVQPAT